MLDLALEQDYNHGFLIDNQPYYSGVMNWCLLITGRQPLTYLQTTGMGSPWESTLLLRSNELMLANHCSTALQGDSLKLTFRPQAWFLSENQPHYSLIMFWDLLANHCSTPRLKIISAKHKVISLKHILRIQLTIEIIVFETSLLTISQWQTMWQLIPLIKSIYVFQVVTLNQLPCFILITDKIVTACQLKTKGNELWSVGHSQWNNFVLDITIRAIRRIWEKQTLFAYVFMLLLPG